MKKGIKPILLGLAVAGFFACISVPSARASTDVYKLVSGFPYGTGFNGAVTQVLETSTGKLVVLGTFTSYNGITANSIIRLNQDGTIDSSFATGTGITNTTYLHAALNSDDTIIATGCFGTYNGTTVGGIVKINTDGSINSTFKTNQGSGFNNCAKGVAIDPNGKIYIVGLFDTYNGTTSHKIIGLNADGSINATFNVGTGLDASPTAINYVAGAIQISGGGYTTYNGTSTTTPIALNTTGSINTTLPEFNGAISSVVSDSSNHTYVAGSFTTYGGVSVNNLIRINSTTGALDSTFSSATAYVETAPAAMAIDASSRLLVTGGYYGARYGGTLYFAPTITRINTDGSVDTTFDVGYGLAGGSNAGMVVLSNGDIVVGGAFTSYYDGTTVKYLARLSSSTPSTGDTTYTSDSGTVAFNNSNLYYSPGNWNKGTTGTETSDGGAYIKLAFTGTTLKLGVNTLGMESAILPSIILHTYIDSTSTTPVSSNLGNVSSSTHELTITTSLSSGSHWAIIYLSTIPASGKGPNGASYSSFSDAAWREPNLRLRVTHIELANDGSGAIQSLTGTTIAPYKEKVLLFGDSITLFSNDQISETAYSADLANLLGAEYGQIAFGNLGWNTTGSGGVPVFYNNTSTSLSSWLNYSSSTSRLVGGALSGGFVGGAPNAVFVNMGTNDKIQSSDTTLMRTKVALFLADLRTALGSIPAIFVISPFSYAGSGTYWTALQGGYSDYTSAHPSDTRIYFLDLGSSGNTTVVNNSTDFIHPNVTGSSLLAQSLSPLASSYITDYVTTISSVATTTTSTGATVTWSSDGLGSSKLAYGPTSAYSTYTSETNTSPRVYSHSVTISGLTSCSVYHYAAVSKDSVGDIASSTDATFATVGCIPSVTTSTASSVTQTLATLNSSIISVGDANATQSGFAWGTGLGLSGGDTATTTEGSQPGAVSFTHALSNLSCNTTYYYRAYATNSAGTGYGAVTSFTSSPCTQTATAAYPGGASAASQQANLRAIYAYNNLPCPEDLCGPSLAPKAVSMPAFSRNLQAGSSGVDVRNLQKYLNEHGYVITRSGPGSSGHETTFFGSLTRAALARFQKAHDLPATGFFGPLTRKLISKL